MPSLFRRRDSRSQSRSVQSASPFRRNTDIVDNLTIQQSDSNSTEASSRSGTSGGIKMDRKSRSRTRSASPFPRRRTKEKSKSDQTPENLNSQRNLESIEGHTIILQTEVPATKKGSSKRSRSFSPFRFKRKDKGRNKNENKVVESPSSKSLTSSSSKTKQKKPPLLPKSYQTEENGLNKNVDKIQTSVEQKQQQKVEEPTLVVGNTSTNLESIGIPTKLEEQKISKVKKSSTPKNSPRRSRSFSPFRRKRKEAASKPPTPPHDVKIQDLPSMRNETTPTRPSSRPPISSKPPSPPSSAMKRLFKSSSSKKKKHLDSLGSSQISFDSNSSVMMYPPSKLTNHSGKRTDSNPESEKQGGRIRMEGRDDDEKRVDVDYPVHTQYRNVLVELRQEMDQKKGREAKFSTDRENVANTLTDKEKNNEVDRRRLSRLNEHISHSESSFDDNVREEPHSPHQSPLNSTRYRDDNHSAVANSTGSLEQGDAITNRDPALINTSAPVKDQQILSTSHENSKDDEVTQSEKVGGHSSILPPSVIEVHIGNALEQEHAETQSLSSAASDSQSSSTVKDTIHNTSSYRSRHSSTSVRSKRQSSGKRVKVKKGMSSSKSKSSIRRLFNKPQQQDERPNSKMQERRRNFTFMKSPSKKKMSNAAMERNRARAKQLADFAKSPEPNMTLSGYTSQAAGDAMSSFGGFHGMQMQQETQGLNFDALENESVISGMTSVYDMDTFDDQSMFSSTSNFSRRSSKPPKSRNRLESFNSSSRRRQPHQSPGANIFEGSGLSEDAFHPINMKKHISVQNHAAALSETGGMAGMGNSSRLGQRNSHSSGASVMSTSSSVSGAAARRLMRRAMKSSPGQSSQQRFSSFSGSADASVTSEGDSQQSNFEESHDSFSRSQGNANTSNNTHEGEFGLTFDAFGLDEHQIDDDVNAAIAELAETDPNVSILMNDDRERQRKFASTETVSTASLSAPSKPSHQFGEDNRSIFTDKENSVASTLTRSSDSAHQYSQKVPRTIEDRYRKPSARKMENDEQLSAFSSDMNEFNRRNSQTLRNVKERMKAKDTHVTKTQPSRVNKFKAFALPDIGSNDSEDSDPDDQGSDQQYEDDSYGEDLQSNPSDELMTSKALNRPQEQKSVSSEEDSVFSREKNQEQKSVSSEGESSSSREEPTPFIPRKTQPSQLDETASESQRRAFSWAAERSAPILISPLLTPTTNRQKKVTSSQKRAKAWAGECEEHPDVMDRAPPLKAEESIHNRGMSIPEEPYTPPPQKLPYRSPKQTLSKHLAMDEHNRYGGGSINSNTSASADREVNAINAPSIPRKSPEMIGHRLPMPAEKVELRKTQSPAFRPDYDTYKTSAPSVALRRVETKSPAPVAQNPNFLANIKLRKVSAPAPRVQQDKTIAKSEIAIDRKPPPSRFENSDASASNEYLEDDESSSCESERAHYHEEIDESRAESSHLMSSHADESFLSEKAHYHEELNESKAQSSPHMPSRVNHGHSVSNRQYEVASQSHSRSTTDYDEQHSPYQYERTEYQDELIEPSPETSSPMPFRGNHSRLTNNHQQVVASQSQRRSPSDHSWESKKQIEKMDSSPQVAHPVAAMFAARQKQVKSPVQDVLPESRDTIAHPLAAMLAARGNNKKPELKSNKKDNIAHPVAAMLANRAEEVETSPKIKSHGDIANPVAALFAARAQQAQPQSLDTPDEIDIQEQAPAQAISSMLNRAVAEQDEDEDEDIQLEEPNKPSMNNLSALFAQRSAMMKPVSRTNDDSKNKMPDNEPSRPESKSIDLNGRVALKDDPKYAKYFKMLKMGLPMGAVKNAMTRDGEDPDIMDGDHNLPVGNNSSSGVPLKDDPKYAKYFKMFKMGLPMGAVKNAMERDGVDASVMDGDHNAPASNGSIEEAKSLAPLPKDKFRRTRVHWDTLGQVKSTSMWALVNQDPDVEDIQIDENEFAELFQAEAGKVNTVDSSATKKSNAVKVIDPKRANNGGIVLARLKVTYEEMAVAIDNINDKVMNIEQVQGILDFIPTKEEKHALRNYMTSSDKDSADAFDELCECEKFMVAMMTVKHSREKVRALLFKLQFRQCVADLESDVVSVEKSCDELIESAKLRKLLGIVLNIGNRLNTAGPTRKGKAGAFTIDSLLKLNQAKAFDKKTTFLHYIVLIVLRHNEVLTNFKDDLPSVMKSDKIYWDQIENDLEEVENQLENVRKIALHEVFGKKRRRRKRNNGDDDDISHDSMSLEEEVEALRSTRVGIFTLQAIKIVSALRENVEVTRTKFKRVLEYFGQEDNKKLHPHELFEIICHFTKNFDVAKEEVLKMQKEKAKENAKKEKSHPGSQSPGMRSIDSSKNSEVSTRSERPIRASSMQPHMNSLVAPRAVSEQNKNREDGERGIPPMYESTSSRIVRKNREIHPDTFENGNPHYSSSKSFASNYSSASEAQTFDETEFASLQEEENSNSEDVREEYDENSAPSFARTERSSQSQSEEESEPFHVVENNFSTSQESTNASSVRSNEDKNPVSLSHPKAQNMRQRARAMRQERIRSTNRTPPVTMNGTPPMTVNRRRPPTPETMGSAPRSPSPAPSSNERIITRRERLARRQRQQRSVGY